MSTVNRVSITARNQLLIAGIQKHLMNVASMTFNGVAYTPATLIALFQSQIDSAGNVGSLKAKWLSAAQADKILRTMVAIVLTGLREMVRQMFTDAQVLADFGFTPRKTARPTTPAKKVVAVAKRAATRVARHTTGPKQKLETKGALAGPIVIEPPPAPVVIGSPPAVAAPGAAHVSPAPVASPAPSPSPAPLPSPSNGAPPATPHS